MTEPDTKPCHCICCGALVNDDEPCVICMDLNCFTDDKD